VALLNLGGVFLGEYWADRLGDPRRDTVGRGVRRLDLGDPSTDGGGDDICRALTDDGDRNAGRGVPRTVGMKSSSLSSRREYSDTPDILGDLDRYVTELGIFFGSVSDMEPTELRGL